MIRAALIAGTLLLLILAVPAKTAAQAADFPFPDLSTPGVADIPDAPADPVIPFIDLTVRNPESGREVAFSLQLLLL
ncbi:MAG: flagellar biosynthetic protein FliP, partial [Treponema sp.]|nr:flagellar biosynthetic protein FliP [Treponema sp.]